jgi:hypothetical protein
MSLNISPQTEARITEKARRQGITVDALLEQLINDCGASARAADQKSPELPVWHLGVIGTLRRRDIYDNAP